MIVRDFLKALGEVSFEILIYDSTGAEIETSEALDYVVEKIDPCAAIGVAKVYLADIHRH